MIYIDNYTKAKVQRISTTIFQKYKPYMFLTRLERPDLQQKADEYVNSMLKISDEKYQEALKVVEENSWYNNYIEINIPEVQNFVDIRINAIIKMLREIKILK